ncbi:MAG: ABC transporter substrate-binding protein [Spirochaetes bacterium]|nr:ABC transporter substrate-binding protein [Spirochaetota bacterium]MBU0954641.1 ABC transporter substrate-binding protein [Spirochaetota bacterium]
MLTKPAGLILLWILLLFSTLLLGACGASHAQPTILIVTKDQSITSSLNPSRLLIASALALEDHAHEEASSSPHVRHHVISYTGSEEDAMVEVESYIRSNKDVIAVVGDIGSSSTRLLAQLAYRHSIPHVSFFATDDDIFRENSWSFSYRAGLQQETDSLMGLIQGPLNIRKVAVIASTNATVNGRWQALNSELDKANVQISALRYFERETSDFRPYLQDLQRSADFDAMLIFVTSNQIEHILQQIRLYPIGKPLIVSPVSIPPDGLADLTGLYDELYSAVQRALLGLQDGSNSVLNRYAERYRVAMGTHSLDPLGLWIYDGMDLLCELAESSQTRYDLYRKLLEYDQSRLFTWISFDENRLIKRNTFTVVQIKNGRFEKVDGYD